ncbi:TPA: hypothetical protein DHW51_05375 [Candidatus Poribacteria bacterium]|nr:hypothetical protein [Candidatus Poribacteria bacterium]
MSYDQPQAIQTQYTMTNRFLSEFPLIMMCSFKEDPNDTRRFNFIAMPNGNPKVLKDSSW